LNLAFDPVAAAQTYASMDTEELVRIAYLEPDYVAEAKALALRELDKRGVPANPKKLIRQVRDEIRDNAGAAHRLTAANIEQGRRLELRFVAGMLILVLWLAALFAPIVIKEARNSTDGAVFLLLGGWAIAVVVAVRKAWRGKRRQLYLVVVIPAVLLVAGIIFRMVK
jgi:hypothetical protein